MIAFVEQVAGAGLVTLAAVLVGAGLLHLIPRLGAAGKRMSAALCAGMPLDLLVTYFTVLPLFVGPILAGWAGLLGAVLGQLAGLVAWTFLHELAHLRTHGRAKILRATNQIAGTAQNLIAVFWTAWCVPVFWLIRVAQHLVYPPLNWLIDLPKYDSREWVNVSRHKFTGLVGHDRIWCLYCDWMTGVWSLATEMLRNVESFWCPIRFSDSAKCANCAIDFPDINNGWVPADGTMDDVVQVLEQHYDPHSPTNPWFGHPSHRPIEITVNGKRPLADLHASSPARGVTSQGRL